MDKKKTKDIQDKTLILPFLAFENLVLCPEIPQPVKIETEEQQEYLTNCSDSLKNIFIGTLDEDNTRNSEGNIKEIGVVCSVDKILQMPGAPSLAFLRPLYRARFETIIYSPAMRMAKVSPLKSITPPKRLSENQNLLLQRIDSLVTNVMHFFPDQEKGTAENLIKENSANPLQHIYSIIQVTPTQWQEKYKLLECNTFNKLAETLAVILDETEQRIGIQASIHEKTHRELSRQQRENYLRMSLKQIQDELGEESDNDEIAELMVKSHGKNWNEYSKKHFQKEINKLRKLNPNNPDYSVQFSYLENLLELPWLNYSNSDISLSKVEVTLNRDHFGLEKVKERIMEYMAVLKLRNDLKAPILCLYGPPGVGKTSVGKSIAEAIGREYARISLGGMHDESEVRGHRRTYIGAMPGRIIKTLSKLKYGNPLILLDEIDKVGKDFKGDPSSALLEALDPEQNNTFHDNFIDFPYDLSKVLFIATANDLSTIPAPLRDRMEIIEMSGYIPAEKREIALRHLVGKTLTNNGFDTEELNFTQETVDFIIRYYTREAGVRQLEKKLGKIIRKIALKKASGKNFPTIITPEIAEELLGKREVNPENYENNDFAGVATGLAWTPSGGEILSIETSLSPGKGEKITLTGNLGDVMKESAVIALQYLKAHAEKVGINPELFSKYDIHIHVPEGAVPKDGPSAGITIASSMMSAFTGRKMRERTAMTGEITLRGKVLPVGGIKEKIIAARQAGIERIILSEQNRKDIEEIQSQYIEGLQFVYVKTLTEVFEEAIMNQPAMYSFNL